jgi:dihydroorotate dehydrogenase (fumarate)
MTTLNTTYTGIALETPLVVAACSLSGKIDTIKALQDAGAGALVIKSLFEEQILHERGELEAALETGAERFPEALSYFPNLSHAEAAEHVMWVRKTRDAVTMPLFASLNAVSAGKWVEYARRLADTGVNGIELNPYAVEADPAYTAAEVETRLAEIVSDVKDACKLPVAVKLSPFYTCLANVVSTLEAAGADAVVLFNRFLQPEIDPETQSVAIRMSWSTSAESRLPQRWIALLHGRVTLDLVGNTGAADGADVARYILAGAQAVQVAGALCRNGPAHLTAMRDALAAWMADKGYADLDAFRGACSQSAFRGNPAVFERAQYVNFLLGR